MYKSILLLFIFTQTTLLSYSQYPDVSDEDQKKSREIMKEAYQHSDEAWKEAKKVVEQEILEGKPYIPWAFRPTDLPQAEIPAFPGAEGGGMYSYGGRGGEIYTVENLNDNGPGSFRWACEQGGARIIVFNVTGIIKLKTPLIIRAPYHCRANRPGRWGLHCRRIRLDQYT